MASSVIGALRVNLGLDSAQFTKGAKEAESTTKRIGRSMQKIGAAVSVVGAGIALAIRGQLNLADEAGKTAQTLGLPVEQLTRFRHAAAMSGSSAATLEGAFKRLSVNMLENGGRFEALGISVRDASGNMRSADAVMADLSDVLAAMPDGAEKTALAMELMGRSGADLIPMLNGGRDALQGMLDEADALGITISTETAEAAAQFNDNIARLTATIRGWVTLITAELAPVLARVTDAVVAASEGFRGMSPVMRQVAAAVAGITVVAGPVLVGLGTLLVMGKALIAPFTGIAALLGGAVKIAFAGLAAVIATVGLPITLLIAGVAGLTAVVIKFWPEIKQATAALRDMAENALRQVEQALITARDGIDRFTENLIDLGNRGVEFVKEKLRELIAFLRDLPAQMRQAGADLMSGLVDGVTSGAARARDAIGDAARGLINRFRSETQTRSPSRVFAELGGYLMDGLAVGIRENARSPLDAMSQVTAEMGEQVGSAASQISTSFESAFVGIATGSMKARDAISRLMQDLARLAAQSAFRSLFGGLGGGGFLSGLFGGFRAEGGPVSAGRSYIVGERGPELFTPGASGQITSNEALRSGGGGGKLSVAIGFDQSMGGFTARVMDDTGQMIASAFQQYDREVLPARVSQVSRDPRARGR